MKPEQITPHEVETMLQHIEQHGESAEFNGDTMRAVLLALKAERTRAPKPGERVVDCREWDILNEIARIVRPRCRKLDKEELLQAIRQLDANRAVVKVLGSIAP